MPGEPGVSFLWVGLAAAAGMLVLVLVAALMALWVRAARVNQPRPIVLYRPSQAQRRWAATKAWEQGDPDATMIIPNDENPAR
ncbi:hypothetical protein [Amycolatopsis thermophila]|uniref:DUF2510 domain-containing protein n=1 Tax=Amycolatopsis thermophila TaxID=206084 RepID=A0ABU0EMK2_9PSEU|nr:hypothetical protein [Amycolatopsis thermophila]MDQ0376516.1 hypothetical protein [Amycolatopsis thermophila]